MGVFEPEHDMSISIHALLAESDTLRITAPLSIKYISIHALLAESDRSRYWRRHYDYISIHALLAESDFSNLFQARQLRKFLSTLSLRRATWSVSQSA